MTSPSVRIASRNEARRAFPVRARIPPTAAAAQPTGRDRARRIVVGRLQSAATAQRSPLPGSLMSSAAARIRRAIVLNRQFLIDFGDLIGQHAGKTANEQHMSKSGLPLERRLSVAPPAADVVDVAQASSSIAEKATLCSGATEKPARNGAMSSGGGPRAAAPSRASAM
jgi:hypothetical protein